MTLVYLGTPYSKHPAGLDCAHKQTCKAAARLMRNGARVYSPIAHSHPIADLGGLNPLDHSLWLPQEEAMMDASDELWIVQMPGWDDSYRIEQERKAFHAAGKPIKYLSWPQLEEVNGWRNAA